MLRRIRTLFHDEKGIAPLEYAILAGLMFSIILNAFSHLAPKMTSAFGNIGKTLVERNAGT
jgi:Flp pilus assembly pilin Flp